VFLHPLLFFDSLLTRKIIQLLGELSSYLANCHLPLRIFIVYLTYFILVLVFDEYISPSCYFVLVFDESTLRFDFHCVSISSPHLLIASPSHRLNLSPPNPLSAVSNCDSNFALKCQDKLPCPLLIR
jgi:hypothetical protein